MAEKQIDQGFEPILGKDPGVLVLGTMPSVASLESQQYYGHPRNSFWWMMEQLCGFESSLTYDERSIKVTQHGVAVWDVIHSCHRPGSLDADIDQETLIPNRIKELLAQNTGIQAVAFNGQAAHKLFKKHVGLEGLSQAIHILPSTSPANASMSREIKLEKWLCIQSYMR